MKINMEWKFDEDLTKNEIAEIMAEVLSGRQFRPYLLNHPTSFPVMHPSDPNEAKGWVKINPAE